jgi:pimeloyl-ACP methyl ester carboxylesterase
MSAMTLPLALTKLSYLDNPWVVSQARADMAGLVLADSLIDRNLGTRPITLVGFSLGARVIFSCLKELAARGAFGLVQNVYMFGTPVVAKNDEYIKARAIVPGRFVNGYATNDWILGKHDVFLWQIQYSSITQAIFSVRRLVVYCVLQV